MSYVLKLRLAVIVAILSVFILSFSAISYITEVERYQNELRDSVVSVVDPLLGHRGTGWIADINGDRVIVTAKHILIGRIDGSNEIDKISSLNMLENILIYVTAVDDTSSCTSIISYNDDMEIEENKASDWIILACPACFSHLPALRIADNSPEYGELLYWCGFSDTGESAVSDIVVMGDYTDDMAMCRLGGIFGPGASGSPIYDPERGVVAILTRAFTETHYGIGIDLAMIREEIETEYITDVVVRF